MNFLWVNVTFYDTVNIILDIIVPPNPYPYTVKFVAPPGWLSGERVELMTWWF